MTSTTSLPSHRLPSNGSPSTPSPDNLSVSEIKELAKSDVQRIKNTASPSSLLHAAQDMVAKSATLESSGELKSALRAYYVVSNLVQALYETQQYKTETADPKRRTTFYKEFKDFNTQLFEIVLPRIKKLEEKLKDIEIRQPSRENGDGTGTAEGADGPTRKHGGSIADRITALQGSGLSVSASRRLSRDMTPTSPTSTSTRTRPPPIAPKPATFATSVTSPVQSQHPSLSKSPSQPLSSVSSPHTFVSTSSFGPPSPTSSVASSPPPADLAAVVAAATASLSSASPPPSSTRFSYPARSESEFATAFPSIDEINERLDFLPSVPKEEPGSVSAQPTTKPPRGPLPRPPSLTRGPAPQGHSPHNTGSSTSSVLPPSGPISPTAVRGLPSIYERGPPPQRPASTPIPPIANGIGQAGSSGENSPTRPAHRDLPQASSSIPPSHAPNYVTRTPAKYLNGYANGASTKPDLPVTSSIQPHVLKDYRKNYPALKILYLDLRTRAEFDEERIQAHEVVCLEPHILTRDNVTSSSIENALVISPSSERALFSNRAKFDLIVVYDKASSSTTSAVSSLVQAIFEKEFIHPLRRVPVFLIGGIEAWKREAGSDGVVTGKMNGSEPSPTSGSKSTALSPSPEPSHNTSAPLNPTNNDVLMPTPAPSGPPPVSPLPTSQHSSASGAHDPHERWIPTRPRSSTQDSGDRRPHYATQTPIVKYTSTSPAEEQQLPETGHRLTRKPAMNTRPQSSGHIPSTYTRPSLDSHMIQPPAGYPHTHHSGNIQYPSTISSGYVPYPASSLASSSTSSAVTATTGFQSMASESSGLVSPPPRASINPSSLSGRRNDYVDQAHQAYSGVTRPSIEYPDLSSQHVLRPPPVAASSALERQDHRPRAIQHVPSFSVSSSPGPLIKSDYPVSYWGDIELANTGLKNLGNTCYMNSTIQCLSATVPFARFFTDGRWKNAVNMLNPLGSKGNMARAFATLLHQLWHGDVNYLAPYDFRKHTCLVAPQFGGTEQHDSQEFLSVLLDTLHEDLNRVLKKPVIDTTPEREAQLEVLPQQIASEQEWKIYRMRNDSIIVDYFQGQFRNRLQCQTCHHTSTTYNAFMYLSLPIPNGRGKASLYQCLDAFVKEEVLEKTEAWNCPKCKTLRKATKLLSLSRLPPVLLIHLKRFSNKGVFTDKLDTLIDYPLRGLDLTNYMPAPLPPGMDTLRGQTSINVDDPRTQLPPYKYDLYAVTNHTGSLTGGHYTAYLLSRGGWLYCDDSSVKNAAGRSIVSQQAYILFYKRIKA
ncbi:hypothetical protein M422DRAFT_23895 [Sphaerobolus stellatus SS14]|nr:hypothetical protein M422DRAFT_23895 [Sphaerobolus stellatus SS14]